MMESTLQRKLLQASLGFKTIIAANARCCVVDGYLIKGRQLAAMLNREIGDGDDRAARIARAARAGGIEPSTLNQILNGSINCPPLARLRGFARALNVSFDSLRRAAQRDGCEYD